MGGGRLAANVLNPGEQVRPGVRNWVFVSCAHRDTRLGEYFAHRRLAPADYTCRYYGAMVPSLITITGGVGVCILNSILGGQALSSIANISWRCVVQHLTRSWS
jgi:hypothetical protein